MTLHGLGTVLKRQHKYAQARAHYERAIEVLEANGGPNAPGIGFPLINLANLERELHEEDAAEKLSIAMLPSSRSRNLTRRGAGSTP